MLVILLLLVTTSNACFGIMVRGLYVQKIRSDLIEKNMSVLGLSWKGERTNIHAWKQPLILQLDQYPYGWSLAS